MLKKVFGIISYFPNSDSAYHTEMRTSRTRRFFELLYTLENLWPDVDIIIIAQNWNGLEIPGIKNSVTVYHYPKLGILGARRELRHKFLESEYDYLIMLDDDGKISADDPSLYMSEIDKHPGGVGVIRHNRCPLMLMAISKDIYSQIDMPEIRAENGEGFEDDIFVASCFAKFSDKAFDFPQGIVTEISFRYEGSDKVPSTWSKEKKLDWTYMREHTKEIVKAIENGVNI